MSEIKLSETELKRLRDRTDLSRGLWFAMDSNFPEVRVKNILEELGYEIKKKEG